MQHTQNRRSRRKERGAVLVTVILIIVMLAGLSVAFLQEGLAESRNVQQRKASVTALEICEMGLAKATLEIYALKDSGTDGIGVVNGDFGGGSYEVTSVQHPDNPDRWVLTASGEYRTATRRVEVGLRRRNNNDFVEGLFAKDTLVFNGSTQTDAYDSNLGAYADQAVNNDPGGSYAEGGGHVGSNVGIRLNSTSVTVRGNAIPGPLYTVTMAGNPTVWGDILPRRFPIELPSIGIAEFEAAMANNNNAELGGGKKGGGPGNGGPGGPGGPGTSTVGTYNAKDYSLRANGQGTVKLSGGTYFFTSVVFTGGTILQIDGPTTIYVTGDFDVSGGGLLNTSGKPSDLKIYAHPYPLGGKTPTRSHVKVTGGAGAALALYGPGADLTVHGSSDVFGSMIAKTITVAGNSKFHYDKALGKLGGHGVITIERLYWRDLDERVR